MSLDNATAEKMIEVIARHLAGHYPEKLEPGDEPCIDGYLRNGDPGHYWWRNFSIQASGIFRVIESEIEALIHPPVVHIDRRLTESELDNAEKIYHSVRRGRMGSINTVRMALEIVIREYLKSSHDTQVTPGKPAEPLHNKSAEWKAGYLWGLSGAAEAQGKEGKG